MKRDDILKHIMIFIAAIGIFVLIISNVKCSSDNVIVIEANPSPNIKVARYHYNGHDYLGFRNEYDNRAGLSHDPDCQKCKEEMKKWIIEVIKEVKDSI